VDAGLSAANPNIKRLRRLSGRRSSRADEGAFVIEGPTLVREALDADVAVEAIYVDADREDLAAEFEARWPDVYRVAPGVLASVLPAVSPQPVCAVAPTTLVRPLDDVVLTARDADRPVLVLVDAADPGNVGTLLRAAESSGCGGVVLAGTAVDVFNPKVVRSSAGSLFRLPVSVGTATAAALVAIAELGVPTVAAVARDGVPHLDAPLAGAVAIVLGNEAHGLADDVIAACDATVTITMDGRAESLNVAMAGTVLCFEALRRRLAS